MNHDDYLTCRTSLPLFITHPFPLFEFAFPTYYHSCFIDDSNFKHRLEALFYLHSNSITFVLDPFSDETVSIFDYMYEMNTEKNDSEAYHSKPTRSFEAY